MSSPASRRRSSHRPAKMVNPCCSKPTTWNRSHRRHMRIEARRSSIASPPWRGCCSSTGRRRKQPAWPSFGWAEPLRSRPRSWFVGVNLSCRRTADAVAIVAADPLIVDMKRVARTEQLVDDICDGRLSLDGARSSLDAISRAAPVSETRFAIMAAVGAAALGIIFGTFDLMTLALIAFSAGAGAIIRRTLARFTPNPLIQPLCAALFSGVTGAVATTHGLTAAPHLVMVCPCMVLVPGPHMLNGALDLARARIPIGVARIVFASLVVLMICTGLMIGLSLAGATLSDPSPATTVPLVFDVIAAGVAVAAYGSFFNMPWKTPPNSDRYRYGSARGPADRPAARCQPPSRRVHRVFAGRSPGHTLG